MSEHKNWIITISGDRNLSEVQRDLVNAGFAVNQVYGEIGSLSGHAPQEVAEKIKGIKGVADVSPDTSIDIGPGDSELTW